MNGPLNELAAEATRIADEKGFTKQPVGTHLMLIVTEVSEAMEDYRKGKLPGEVWYERQTPRKDETGAFCEPLAKPCGIPSEIADVIIRCLDFCSRHEIDIDNAIAEKMAYNATRPHKHGKIV
jgi:NTP pyrophosphatase (non-canonical NTP hydrolase)